MGLACIGAILLPALAYRLQNSAVGQIMLLPTLAYRLHHTSARQATSDDQVYEVYSATIRELFLKNDDGTKSPDDLAERLIVVKDHTISYRPEREDDAAKTALFWTISGVVFDVRTVEDFNRKCKDSISLQTHFTLPGKQVLISDQELDQFFGDKGSRWQGFYERYPKSNGFISVSRVGFNPDHSQAFLYAAASCGGLCGEGYYVLLGKDGGVWSVKRKTMLWIS